MRSIVSITLLLLFVIGQFVFADTTSILRPTTDGGDDSASWTNTAGGACNTANCYLEVDETSCDSDTSYIQSNTNGASQTFDIDESGIPDNSTITQIDITVCQKRVGTAPPNKFQTRRCIDGSCANSGTDIGAGGNYAEATQSYAGLSIDKTASTDIEIGVAITDTNNKQVRISQVSAVITYTPPTPTPAPTTPTPTAGTPAVRPEIEEFAPKRVLFSGSSYPLSRVELLRKESPELGFQSLFDTKTTILSDGTFTILVGGLAKGEHFFGIRAQDPQGRNSNILSFAVSLLDVDNYEVKEIILQPTVELKNRVVRQDEGIEVLGYAGRNSTIEVEIDDKLQLQQETRTDPSGSGAYNFLTDASSFSPGIHYLRVRQRLVSGIVSLFSTPISFKISLLSSPRADFNNDDKVNITDWSIFLYRWSSKDKELRKSIDLDQNNEINIGDFSIFLKSLTM